MPRQASVVARALEQYGVIVADDGSDWFVTGAPHRGWDDEQVNALKALRQRLRGREGAAIAFAS